ncbi:hypothetical protein JDV02_009427 [Purpureocillium takamizusanense]|uniref:Uncharacterized protein n=1 Tax=Purpureocillium takamizusanense TaxID=2060973 RepID=A0A9Q8QPX7_9HYPO|nr:uncharacterized protein JDV02_009427 [Purpureocillium takamizusanense]UNI23618.1 hypothetical protein JDV02_009427 [Purpureocillium takamizusanense]
MLAPPTLLALSGEGPEVTVSKIPGCKEATTVQEWKCTGFDDDIVRSMYARTTTEYGWVCGLYSTGGCTGSPLFTWVSAMDVDRCASGGGWNTQHIRSVMCSTYPRHEQGARGSANTLEL